MIYYQILECFSLIFLPSFKNMKLSILTQSLAYPSPWRCLIKSSTNMGTPIEETMLDTVFLLSQDSTGSHGNLIQIKADVMIPLSRTNSRWFNCQYLTGDHPRPFVWYNITMLHRFKAEEIIALSHWKHLNLLSDLYPAFELFSN